MVPKTSYFSSPLQERRRIKGKRPDFLELEGQGKAQLRGGGGGVGGEGTGIRQAGGGAWRRGNSPRWADERSFHTDKGRWSAVAAGITTPTPLQEW